LIELKVISSDDFVNLSQSVCTLLLIPNY